jgi:hypothetical protein
LQFSLSRDAAVTVEHIGHERQPLVIIDDALAAPDELRKDAETRAFAPIGPYYPGVRAAIADVFAAALCASIQPLVREHLNIRRPRWTGTCFYSLVTTPPARLALIQRLPHFDGFNPESVAILYYLGQADQGGTSFFRHKASGFETVTEERFPAYKTTLESELRTYGTPPPRYIDDGAPLFERTRKVDAAFNRMLIYRGVMLHSGAIDNMSPLHADPARGRLTVTGFLDPAP